MRILSVCLTARRTLLDVDLFDNIGVIDAIDASYVEKLLHDCFCEAYFSLSIVSPF